MNKSNLIYRLIIFGVVVIAIFVFRTFFQNDKTPGIPPETKGINRNIVSLIFTKHARCRMKCRDITEGEVKEILHKGNINYMKSNFNNDHGPTYALEGYSQDRQHLRIVFAPKKAEMIVVTCIDLDKEYICDCN